MSLLDVPPFSDSVTEMIPDSSEPKYSLLSNSTLNARVQDTNFKSKHPESYQDYLTRTVRVLGMEISHASHLDVMLLESNGTLEGFIVIE